VIALRASGLVALLLPVMVSAQVRPVPGPGDPRIQVVDWQPDQVVLVEGAPGYQVTIELAPDEVVQSAAVGDSANWQVTANKAGNRLFVKPVQAGAATNLTVFTDVRSYAFDLTASAGGTPPYTIRFRYAAPGATPAPPPPTPSTERRYRLGGERSLRPVAMHDDGVHTYIEWAADAPLPAAYTVDGEGRETLANGNMQGGIYVIDSVAERLVFRIDRAATRARRLPPLPDEER
jgi:type IV secretion system protein VirB9